MTRLSLHHALFLFGCALHTSLATSLSSEVNPRNNDFDPNRFAEELPKCNICAFPGSTLRNDFVPSFTKAAARFAVNMMGTEERFGPIEDSILTCSEWNDYSEDIDQLTADSSECLDLRDWLSWQCCDGMPPVYQCETEVEDQLLSDGAKYKRNKIPITGQTALDVSVSVHVTDVSIANYGVDGGGVEVSGSLKLSWVDERLKWNYTEAGCASIVVERSDIWVPQLIRDHPSDENNEDDIFELSKLSVLADGRVFSAGRLKMYAGCENAVGTVSKVCSIHFLDREDIGRVRYIADSVGTAVSYNENVSIPEYVLDRKQTTILTDSDLVQYSAVQKVQAQFFFRPLDEFCDVCGIDGVIFNGTIRYQSDKWKDFFPDTEELSCFEVNDLLTSLSVHSEECSVARRNFEEACCDDTLSSFECESDIHDRIVEQYNTVTPPDPSANEDDESLQTKDRVDVSISLDVLHVIEIEVKTNTLKMLVNLELSWFDQRLEWEPFIGGCHRASYRASIDAELTEIWVPNIELSNMIEGVQTLPAAHASVYNDGEVVWRRTGVLEGTCELEGIQSFPFDTLSCYFDFGEDRDPHFHRVHYYNSGNVQFYSSLEDDSWNYQEYRLLPDRTEVEEREENLSGFKNKLIRYRFFFDRASNFYLHMFVVTYLLFAYLSIGTFFIDISAGERLGYGTSILFVIVAQDITMTDSTPVTQEFLWIYMLSLGSKCLVIFAIVQTLLVQWLLYRRFEDSQKEEAMYEAENANEREMALVQGGTNNSMSGVDDGFGEIGEEEYRDENDATALENQNVLKNRRDMTSVQGGANSSLSGVDDGGSGDNGDEYSHRTEAPVNENEATASQKQNAITAFPGKAIEGTNKAIKGTVKTYFKIGNKLTSIQIDENDSESMKIKKQIKLADVASAVISTIIYSVFVLVLCVIYI